MNFLLYLTEVMHLSLKRGGKKLSASSEHFYIQQEFLSCLQFFGRDNVTLYSLPPAPLTSNGKKEVNDSMVRLTPGDEYVCIRSGL